MEISPTKNIFVPRHCIQQFLQLCNTRTSQLLLLSIFNIHPSKCFLFFPAPIFCGMILNNLCLSFLQQKTVSTLSCSSDCKVYFEKRLGSNWISKLLCFRPGIFQRWQKVYILPFFQNSFDITLKHTRLVLQLFRRLFVLEHTKYCLYSGAFFQR